MSQVQEHWRGIAKRLFTESLKENIRWDSKLDKMLYMLRPISSIQSIVGFGFMFSYVHDGGIVQKETQT